MTNTDKIKILKDIVSLDYSEYLLFEHDDDVGVIYCDEESEISDLHCDLCKKDIFPFKVVGTEKLPAYLIVSVGPTKFERIKNGWRDSDGLDLNKVRLLNE